MIENKKFTLVIPSSGISNKVSVIKHIRILTGFGLKESKDIADHTDYRHNLTVSTYYYDQQGVNDVNVAMQENFRELRALGCDVGGPVWAIIQDLRNLAAQALQQGEDELAQEIMALVLAEKLRQQ